MHGQERRVDLAHFAEDLAGWFRPKRNGHLPDFQVQRNCDRVRGLCRAGLRGEPQVA